MLIYSVCYHWLSSECTRAPIQMFSVNDNNHGDADDIFKVITSKSSPWSKIWQMADVSVASEVRYISCNLALAYTCSQCSVPINLWCRQFVTHRVTNCWPTPSIVTTHNRKPSYCWEFPNFLYHGNKGQSLVNFNEAIKLHAYENPLSDARFLAIAVMS